MAPDMQLEHIVAVLWACCAEPIVGQSHDLPGGIQVLQR